MNNNDIRTRDELRQAMQAAAAANDSGAFTGAFEELMQRIALDLQAEYDQKLQGVQQELDSRILAQRGVHQLTAEERTYYQKLAITKTTNNEEQNNIVDKESQLQ